jgi:hypothetical protein
MQTITLKIGSAASGRDFSTVAAAWASTPNDWVAADVSYIFEMYNDSEFVPTAAWTFSGKTLDAGHTLIIRPAAGQGYKDNANLLNNALRYNQANGVAVKFAINYAQHIGAVDWVTIEGLQIKSSGNGGISAIAASGTIGSAKVNNCLIEFAGSSSTARAVVLKAGTLQNTYIILTGLTSTAAYYLSGGVAPWVENITVVRLSSLAAATKPAFDSDVAGFKIKNSAAFGCSAFSTRSDYIGSNNASDGNILFGTNNKTNLVYANQFVDTVNDFRVKAGADLIDAGTAPSASNTSTITGVRQQGTAADIGAWEYPSAVQAPTATVTGVTTTNQVVVVTGTTTGNPTSGTASLAVSSVAYNSAVAQGPVVVSLSSGTFTATFNAVPAGRYVLSFSISNSSYTVSGTNPLGEIDVVGPRALSLIQDALTDAQVLTIHGTVEKATSGTAIFVASAGSVGISPQNLPITVNTTVTPNTFTVSATLLPGSYDAPIITFTGTGGTSLPQSGTSPVLVVGPRALTVVQDPVDGQLLTIHGTVEKATSGKVVVPVDATNPNGAIEQTADVTVNTTVTPNTYTVGVYLPPGNYAAPILTFSNAVGPSLPQPGTSAVSIMAISGSPQAPMPAVVPPTDTTIPTMVGVLTVSNKTATGFTVTWQAATDDVGVAYYEVATDGTTFASVGNVLTYSTFAATPSTTYNFKVRAVDAAGNRALPLSTTVVTPAAPDLIAPAMTGTISVSSITSTAFVLSWSAATDNVGVVGYEYSVNNAPYVVLGSVLTVPLTGLTADTSYNISVRAYDAAGNKATPLTTTVKTAATTVFAPSVARTIQVQPTAPKYVAGKFWDMTNPLKPLGTKDPTSTIDITFDWSVWLADIGNPSIANVVFTLSGVENAGSYASGSRATVFVSGGAGNTASVACKITTDSTPPRVDERTVYLALGDL